MHDAPERRAEEGAETAGAAPSSTTPPEPAPRDGQAANRRRWHLARLGVELVAVFLGVSGAFLVTQHQESRRNVEVQRKYYRTLISEFRVLAEHLEVEAEKLEAHQALANEIRRGQTPSLPPRNFYFSYRGSVVDAAFDSRNLESLSTAILERITRGIPALEAQRERVRRLSEFEMTVLSPARAAGRLRYHDAEGSLRPEIQWYLDLIDETLEWNRALQELVTGAAIPDLEASLAGLD